MRLTFALACLLTLAACSPQQETTKGALPNDRPADFQIFLEQIGGSDGRKVHHVIGPDLARQTLFRENGDSTSWQYKPTEDELDDLYQWLRKGKITSFKSERVPGNHTGRYGNYLQLKWADQTFTVDNRGEYAISTQQDFEDYVFLLGPIENFVRDALKDQQAHVDVEVILDVVPDSLSVDLEQNPMTGSYVDPKWKVGDTLKRFANPLKSHYTVEARAVVADSVLTWSKQVDLTKQEKSLTRIHITKSGFTEAQ
jgi:hypothetical protein